MPTLTLIRGLPGSGKTWIADAIQARADSTPKKLIAWFEADLWFQDHNGGKFDANNLPEAHAWCRRMAQYALQDNIDVVVSNTFTRLWELQPYLDMVRQLGVSLQVVYVQSDFESVHAVPPATLAKMEGRWEEFNLKEWRRKNEQQSD